MGREEHCKQIWQACVGQGVLIVYGPHRVFWSYGGVCFPGLHCSGCRVLKGYCPKWALHFLHFPGPSCSGAGFWVHRKDADSVECAFCSLPRSQQLRWPGAWWVHCPKWAVHLNHFLGPYHSVYWCTVRAPSQVCHVSPLGSWSQSTTLLADVNSPGLQEGMVSNWQSAHSLVENAGLWGWDFPLPSGSGCHTRASLPLVGRGAYRQLASSPLVFVQSFVLLSKKMSCLPGCLVSSASIQKLFCGSCSVFRLSFDEIVRENVVSQSYSSATLRLPPWVLFMYPFSESGSFGWNI